MKTLAGQVLVSDVYFFDGSTSNDYDRWLGEAIRSGVHFALAMPIDEINAFSETELSGEAQRAPFRVTTLSWEWQKVQCFAVLEDVAGQTLATCLFRLTGRHHWRTTASFALTANGTRWPHRDGGDWAAAEDIAANVCRAFLAALACKNVAAEVSDQAPPAVVNAKRERNGKSRIFDTHTLVVRVNKGTGEARGATGGHAPPRQHLRRGHIRRLPGGNIWVQSCVVGDAANGFLRKDYRVAA